VQRPLPPHSEWPPAHPLTPAHTTAQARTPSLPCASSLTSTRGRWLRRSLVMSLARPYTSSDHPSSSSRARQSSAAATSRSRPASSDASSSARPWASASAAATSSGPSSAGPPSSTLCSVHCRAALRGSEALCSHRGQRGTHTKHHHRSRGTRVVCAYGQSGSGCGGKQEARFAAFPQHIPQPHLSCARRSDSLSEPASNGAACSGGRIAPPSPPPPLPPAAAAPKPEGGVAAPELLPREKWRAPDRAAAACCEGCCCCCGRGRPAPAAAGCLKLTIRFAAAR
jgi:hypothetical protein